MSASHVSGLQEAHVCRLWSPCRTGARRRALGEALSVSRERELSAHARRFSVESTVRAVTLATRVVESSPVARLEELVARA